MEGIKPLAVLGFKGSGFFSNTVRRCQKIANPVMPNVDVTHVGMAVTTKVLGIDLSDEGVSDEEILIWESTFSDKNLPDIEDHQGIFGVQLRRLKDVVENYNGGVIYRNLINEPTEKQLIKAREVFRRERYKSYPVMLIPILLSAVFNIFIFLRKMLPDFAKRNMFCSQLVAHTLKKTKILELKGNDRNYTPADIINLPIYSEIKVLKE